MICSCKMKAMASTILCLLCFSVFLSLVPLVVTVTVTVVAVSAGGAILRMTKILRLLDFVIYSFVLRLAYVFREKVPELGPCGGGGCSPCGCCSVPEWKKLFGASACALFFKLMEAAATLLGDGTTMGLGDVISSYVVFYTIVVLLKIRSLPETEEQFGLLGVSYAVLPGGAAEVEMATSMPQEG